MAHTDDAAARETHVTAEPTLSERDRRILDFERRWVRHNGAKDDAVREEFALTAARYYQVLNAVIDLPAAIIYDPMLVRRLQRVRDTKTSTRTLQHPLANRTSSFS